MIEALIRSERDPRKLADMARGRMRAKHAALIEALTGRFDDHHGELARILLDQVDTLIRQIDTLTTRIEQQVAAIPAAEAVHTDGPDNDDDQPSTTNGHPLPTPLSAVERLDEIPGVSPHAAQVILVEIGLDMSRFPTADHLVERTLSWINRCRRTTRDYERLPEHHAAMVQWSMVIIMTRRLARLQRQTA